MGEYHSFHSDVLLPQGNYATRTVKDGDHLLVYNFFYAYGNINAMCVLPPPKELGTDKDGRLLLKTYYRWEQMVKTTIHQSEIRIVEHILSKPTATSDIKLDKWTYGSRSGYEIFCFKKPSPVFIGDGILAIEGIDKPGPGERCG